MATLKRKCWRVGPWVQAVRSQRSLSTTVARPAIVGDPVGLSHGLLWEPAPCFPFEPCTPGASSAAWFLCQKVHYTPHPFSLPWICVHCSPAPPSPASFIHTHRHTHHVQPLSLLSLLSCGVWVGERAACPFVEGVLPWWGLSWSGFCHLSFSLGGRKGGNSGGGRWEQGAWRSGGVNRTNAMAIWHPACSLQPAVVSVSHSQTSIVVFYFMQWWETRTLSQLSSDLIFTGLTQHLEASLKTTSDIKLCSTQVSALQVKLLLHYATPKNVGFLDFFFFSHKQFWMMQWSHQPIKTACLIILTHRYLAKMMTTGTTINK